MMSNNKKWLYACLGSCVLIVCLLCHDPYIPTWWYSVSDNSRFLSLSYVSTTISTALYFLWGLGTWAIPLLCLIECGALYIRTSTPVAVRIARLITGVLLVSVLDARFHLCAVSGVTPGGAFGIGCMHYLTRYAVGVASDYSIFVCMFCYILWCIGIAWSRVLIRAGNRFWLSVLAPALERIFEKIEQVWQGASESVQLATSHVQMVNPVADHARTVDVQHTPSIPVPRKVMHGGDTRYKKPSLESIFGAAVPSSRPSVHRFKEQIQILEDTLRQFGIRGSVTEVIVGPVVILYEYQPERNVSISKICAREHDLMRALQVVSLRIIAPIPGKPVVGFECARTDRDAVLFAEHWRALERSEAQLPLLLGVTTGGNPVVVDLATLPHLLVAGSTGSGKSVALNSMIISLLVSLSPQEVRLILIDPKRLEFAWYADIAHLLFPIVTDPREAIIVLRWAVAEMERRYDLMSRAGVNQSREYRAAGHDMPDIVVIIDEWADLMMTGGKDAETSLVRLTQMARAAGIHVIVATQRPSVDVITGLIKVNIPARIACRVISKVDSRTILDSGGAESLAGKGDMLVMMPGKPLERMHGVYLTNQQIQAITCAIRRQGGVSYVDFKKNSSEIPLDIASEDKELYKQVLALISTADEISISLLQRKLRIGYNRSARMIDYLEAHGMILPSDGGKMRKVLR